MNPFRSRFPADALIGLTTSLYAAALLAIAYSRSFALLCTALLIAGVACMGTMSRLNIAAQTVAPNWVRARALAFYLLVFQGGLAVGSVIWGRVAQGWSVRTALLWASVSLLPTLLLPLRIPLSGRPARDLSPSLHWPEPHLELPSPPERGPIMIQVTYRIEQADWSSFQELMQRVRRMRKRDGALRWLLLQDGADPDRFSEVFHVESWVEHVRQHTRATVADQTVERQARGLHTGTEPPSVTHWLAANWSLRGISKSVQGRSHATLDRMAEWLEPTQVRGEGSDNAVTPAAHYAGLLAALLEKREVRDALQFFSRERAWINEQHLAVCRIPSPTFFEQKRAEWVVQQFREYGYEARLDRAGNVLAHAPSSATGRLLAISAHLDTVLAPRTAEEITWRRDGRFHGPGVADNGAGLAALLAMAKVLQTTGMAQGVLFVANVGEEGEGNLSGMRYLCRQSPLSERIGSFLVLDGPTVDHITCQALASRRFEVTVTGVGGHSWGDYGIGNPVHTLSRAVALFADGPAGERCGEARASLNVGVLEGGSSVNSIPTLARAKVDLRSESIALLDEMANLLSDAVEHAVDVENGRCTGGRVAAKIKEIGTRPGGRLAAGAPLLQQLRAVEAHLGIRARLDCASTDANIPLSLGRPAVAIGAGGQGGGAHTPGEWYDPEGRELGLRRILLTTLLLQRSADLG